MLLRTLLLITFNISLLGMMSNKIFKKTFHLTYSTAYFYGKKVGTNYEGYAKYVNPHRPDCYGFAKIENNNIQPSIHLSEAFKGKYNNYVMEYYKQNPLTSQEEIIELTERTQN